MAERIAFWLYTLLLRHVAGARKPDYIIGADDPNGAYLLRWYLTPWRPWQGRMRDRAQANPTRLRRAAATMAGWLPNLYLHRFLRDDDDRALHDHPACAISFILRGAYMEHTGTGADHRVRTYSAGSLRYLPTRHRHRIELLHPRSAGEYGRSECWTLFLFGPVVRDWGFWCGDRFVPWRQFTAPGKPGETGPGCD